jgi:hypothetical protein
MDPRFSALPVLSVLYSSHSILTLIFVLPPIFPFCKLLTPEFCSLHPRLLLSDTDKFFH